MKRAYQVRTGRGHASEVPLAVRVYGPPRAFMAELVPSWRARRLTNLSLKRRWRSLHNCGLHRSVLRPQLTDLALATCPPRASHVPIPVDGTSPQSRVIHAGYVHGWRPIAMTESGS
jgi:hypothetical protein